MVERLNNWGKSSTPFVALIGFDLNDFVAYPLNECAKNGLFFDFEGISNAPFYRSFSTSLHITNKIPPSFETYQKAFNEVKRQMYNGNTYLLNLAFPTSITLNCDNLWDIFSQTKARFRIFYDNCFVCFSPEPFIRIKGKTISTHPMKGTIEASLANAKEKLLNDPKEMTEHVMVVDLLRNDLSRVSTHVNVEKFRYIEEIHAGTTPLLQASSHISGTLEENWQERIGSILVELLPAGSISGAPKKKTVEIIRNVEREKRGFYTGVAVLFDGKNLTSTVLIRFIEKTPNGFLFKSGGGITVESNVDAEYAELIRKVYVPVI